jgi:hypothetical protein
MRRSRNNDLSQQKSTLREQFAAIPYLLLPNHEYVVLYIATGPHVIRILNPIDIPKKSVIGGTHTALEHLPIACILSSIPRSGRPRTAPPPRFSWQPSPPRSSGS